MSDRQFEQQAGATLPIALAISLPFGAYSQIPLIGISMTGLLLVVMAGFTLRQCQHDRLLRPPFEYWWPAAILLPAALVLVIQGDVGQAGYLIQLVLALLIPVTLAANGAVACQAITAFVVACGIGVLLHGAADRAWIPPTVVDVHANILLAGPASVKAGLLLIVSGFLGGLVILIHPDFTAMQRRAAAIAVLGIVAWLGYALSRVVVQEDLWATRPFYQQPMPILGAVLLSLWIGARIAARAVLQARRQAGARRLVFPVAIGVAILAHVLTGTAPAVATVFLLGLAAALDAPWTSVQPSRPLTWIWALPVACILIQVLGWAPLASYDPRNQTARAERLLASESWEPLDGLLGSLRERRPTDPNLALLQARMLLARGWPNSAAEVYCAIPYADAMRAVPVFAANHQSFIEDLRDAASAQPAEESHFFFEQVLIHDGTIDQAASLLEIRRSRLRGSSEVMGNRDTLRAALLTLLGGTEQDLPLEDWDVADYYGVLAHGGVEFKPFPDGLDASTVPDLYYGRLGLHDGAIRCTRLDAAQERVVSVTLLAPPVDGAPAKWLPWHVAADGIWSISLDREGVSLATYTGLPVDGVAFSEGVVGGHRESVACVLFVP